MFLVYSDWDTALLAGFTVRLLSLIININLPTKSIVKYYLLQLYNSLYNLINPNNILYPIYNNHYIFTSIPLSAEVKVGSPPWNTSSIIDIPAYNL